MRRSLPYVAGLGILFASNTYAQDITSDVIAKVVVPRPLVVNPPAEGKPSRLANRLLQNDLSAIKQSELLDMMDQPLNDYEKVDCRIGPSSERYSVSVPVIGRLFSIPTGQLRHDFEQNLQHVPVDHDMLAMSSFRGDQYREGLDDRFKDSYEEAAEIALGRWGAEIAPGAVHAFEEGWLPTILTLGTNKLIVDKFDLYGEANDLGDKYKSNEPSKDDIDYARFRQERFKSGISLGGNPNNPSAKVRVKAQFGMEINLKGEYELDDGFSAEIEVPVYHKRTEGGYVDLSLYAVHADEDDGSVAGFKVSMPIDYASRKLSTPVNFARNKISGFFSRKK